MAKALSSATTPLIILTLTIITSTILYSTYTQTFGSITYSPETVYNIEILQTVNGSTSQLILYNPNPVSIKITETLLENDSTPFTLKYSNMSICKENTIPPNSVAILEIRKPIDKQKTIYLKSDKKIIAYYTKGQ